MLDHGSAPPPTGRSAPGMVNFAPRGGAAAAGRLGGRLGPIGPPVPRRYGAGTVREAARPGGAAAVWQEAAGLTRGGPGGAALAPGTDGDRTAPGRRTVPGQAAAHGPAVPVTVPGPYGPGGAAASPGDLITGPS
eukprot:241391-Hanusia_phi.AAC.1